MRLSREIHRLLTLAAGLIILSLISTEIVRAEEQPQPEAAGTTERAQQTELLEMGQPIEKTLAVGEVHAYSLQLGADRSVTVQIEKQGVTAVATLFAPDGDKLGTFGSTTTKQGTEQFTFVTESAGNYRISVRTLFKPLPPGRYLIKLAGVQPASNQEKSARAAQHCQEKNWLDRESNFLVNEALDSISRCAAAVGRKLGGSDSKAGELAAEANAEASYLISRWQWGEFVSAAYQENLVGDFRMLASAAEEPDPGIALAILKAVVEDLKIKADHCRKSNRGLGKDLDVDVKTIRKTKEEPGLVVYYKLYIYAFKKGSMPPERFNRLSSPTSKKLPAGRYLLWAGQPDPPPLAKLDVLDVVGKDKIEFDLLVP